VTPQGIEETVLVTTHVDDVMREKPPSVAHSTPYTEIIPMLSQARSGTVFVLGADGTYLGAIRIQEVVELASMGDLGPGIIAVDIMATVPSVAPSDSLARAFDLYEASDVEELPVVNAAGRLVGGIARKDVMSVLHVEVFRRQNLRAKFVRRDDDTVHSDYVELPKGAELARVPLQAEHAGRTFGEAEFRARWRLTVLALMRRDEEGREIRVLPEASMRLQAGDDVIVLGSAEDIAAWRTALDGPVGADDARNA
jgi:CBS domain-containing protein